MRIELRTSGGVAGIRPRTYAVDCAQLDARETASWLELVERADFFNLPRKDLSKKGSDLMQYTITVEDGSKLHQVVVDDLTIGQHVRDVVERFVAD